jgi:hypothetical protein
MKPDWGCDCETSVFLLHCSFKNKVNIALFFPFQGFRFIQLDFPGRGDSPAEPGHG